MFRCTKPIIAAINGAGVGFGATFPLPMDVRLASTEARFGFVFSRRGICLDAARAGSCRAPSASAGRSNGRSAAASSTPTRRSRGPRPLAPPARGAARRGPCEGEGADRRHRPGLGRRQPRPALADVLGATPDGRPPAESIYIMDRASSADTVEGAAAFLEKRPAGFPGKVSEDLPPRVPRRGPAPTSTPARTSTPGDDRERGRDGAARALRLRRQPRRARDRRRGRRRGRASTASGPRSSTTARRRSRSPPPPSAPRAPGSARGSSTASAAAR